MDKMPENSNYPALWSDSPLSGMLFFPREYGNSESEQGAGNTSRLQALAVSTYLHYNLMYIDCKPKTKMATMQEMVQCVLWFSETKSVTMVQQNYRQQYARQPPCKQTIQQWFQRKRSGQPRTSDEHIEEHIEEVSQKFQRSPRTSLRCASLQLNIPLSTLHGIIHKKLNYHAYKLQMVQELLPADRPQQKEFGMTMLLTCCIKLGEKLNINWICLELLMVGILKCQILLVLYKDYILSEVWAQFYVNML
uniref:DUF4817 domain-containing protein n=1 Tax=Strigamia maritima TaxID=126957 RepID=T1IL65_STRMM